MTKPVPKLVDSTHYHLWTDALHARALAQQAHNKWDRGIYVRWTITTAWSAFEVACMDALEIPRVGDDFKNKVTSALSRKSPPIHVNWEKGIWQNVLRIRERRHRYTHVSIDQVQLSPSIAEADDAINILRAAVKAIYRLVGKAAPAWVDDDSDRGWDPGSGYSLNLTIGDNETYKVDRASVRIAYIYREKEYIDAIYPPDTDPIPLIDDLIARTQVPISSIRVYQGSQLLEERPITMRGAE